MVVVAASLLFVRDVELRDRLEITAHRTGALGAPENTVAALNQAIVDRADWAEIDVQLTADKQLVVKTLYYWRLIRYYSASPCEHLLGRRGSLPRGTMRP